VVRVAALKGQNVSPGTSLFNIVNPARIWVLANIEEKKVARIQIGDGVNISVDAYPDTVFHGRVEEISGATQSSFSILPTENASGNYTKVAQRLPIKISVVQQGDKLKPGMSAVVTIKTK
jgi:membrane fusion protein (multidrug efflux system)